MTTFDWSSEDNRCFGCGDNPIGLKLRFSREEGWLVAKTKLDDLYQGFKNSAHGGIIATLLDEASAWAAMTETGRLSPSYELQCQFLKPVPLSEEIIVRARVTETRHGIAKTKAKIVNTKGETLAAGDITCRVLNEEIAGIEEELL